LGQRFASLYKLANLTKDMQTEQLLCWSGMTDTEHRTTSSSNEERLSLKILPVVEQKKVF